jgi:hypothetical protein
MMSLGPLVEGYTLLVSRKHISCCGEVDNEWLEEFQQLREVVSAAQVQAYGRSVAYEHGRTGSCLHLSEAHCYHAHLHFVPIDFDIAAAVASDYSVRRYSTWDGFLEAYRARPGPYLLSQDQDALAVAFISDRVPRQYLRSLVAGHLGTPEFADWMAFPRRDVVRNGRVRLGPIIQALARQRPVSGKGSDAQ